MGINAVDSALICLVNIHLPTSCFKEYKCKEFVSIGVDMNSLSKIIASSSSEDFVCFEKNKPDEMNVVISGTKYNKTYTVKLLDINQEELEQILFKFTCAFSMESSLYKSMCRDVSACGDDVVLIFTEGNLACKSDQEHGSIGVHIDYKDEGSHKIIANWRDVKSKFSMRYLTFFAKTASFVKIVEMYTAEDKPLVVEFNFIGGGFVKYFIGPKIDPDAMTEINYDNNNQNI
jgi:proliferating cell nuclear antigen PCNA